MVKQRTALLKSARGRSQLEVDDTLEIWDAKLIDLGSRIIIARRELRSELEEPMRSA